MFGNIINSGENSVTVENKSHTIPLYLKEVHVIFDDNNRKIIGKISSIKPDIFEVSLIGEIIDNKFVTGIYKQPNLTNPPRIVTGNELVTFIGNQNYKDNNTLLIGNSTLYDNYKITANLNNFFSNHFAIIGNSGYGKSCGVARIIQNVFYYKDSPPKNAHFVLFDVYGEYNQAFSEMDQLPGIHFKNFKNGDGDITDDIAIPPYFLDADDLAILLNVEDPFLVPILEKALQYVSIFKSETAAALEYKNNIIATCLLEVLSSGKSAPQMRDQILSILSKYHTKELNESSQIKEPGYTRTIKQCLNIDAQGKINAISLVTDYLNQFKKVDLNDLVEVPNLVYTLEDIYDALDFALLSEGIYNNVSMYERASNLKIHLYHILNSPYRKYFEYKEVISRQEYIEKLFTTSSGEPAQIISINLDDLDDRFAKILTKLYSRLFFNYATTLQDRGSYPINIILEEAHRYVNQDHDIDVIGYNIFDRITKEGRKYGVVMGFITQRPSELSKTALSQCSNFLIFRIFHPEDYKMIEEITSSISGDELERLKTLRRGMALTFGSAFHIPMLVKLDMPNPAPLSSNVDITHRWF